LFVAGLDLFPNGHCTPHGIDDTDKLGQQVVAWSVQELAIVLPDKSGHDFTAGCQGSDGGVLVVTHQAAVPFDVPTENRGEFSSNAFSSHAGFLLQFSC